MQGEVANTESSCTDTDYRPRAHNAQCKFLLIQHYERNSNIDIAKAAVLFYTDFCIMRNINTASLQNPGEIERWVTINSLKGDFILQSVIIGPRDWSQSRKPCKHDFDMSSHIASATSAKEIIIKQ